MQTILEDGAKPASNTPLYGEPLALAASSWSSTMVQLLLDHWDWEDHAYLNGLRLVSAIKPAAAAGRGYILTKLLNYKDLMARSAYDDAIIHMAKCGQTASVERPPVLRHVDPTPAAKMEFELHLVRMAAEYCQWSNTNQASEKLRL